MFVPSYLAGVTSFFGALLQSLLICKCPAKSLWPAARLSRSKNLFLFKHLESFFAKFQISGSPILRALRDFFPQLGGISPQKPRHRRIKDGPDLVEV